MSCTPRHLLITAVTLTTVGAGATSALAAPSDPLVTYLTQQTPKLRQHVGGVGSHAEEVRTITNLTRDRRAVNAAIQVVEHLPAKAGEQSGKKAWLEGERYAARGDSQTIAGLRLIFAGHQTAGANKVNHQWRRNANYYLSDHYNALALRELHIPTS